jgi:NAD(P)-dependent dehydrogenase (short-subunit alcohol dehydrogenase family)
MPPSTAVITGAAGGLGRALALELTRRGASVGLADLDTAGAQRTLEEVRVAEGHGFAMACDVADPEQVEALAARADEELGGADMVVNNAGIAVGGRVGDVPPHEWRRIVDVNLLGVAYGCHAFVPRMRRRGRGHVVNIASAAAFTAAPNMAPYNATKAAVLALSETLAAELRGSGVGVTVACPTFFHTPIIERMAVSDERVRASAQRLMDATSLQPEDVAPALLDAAQRGDLYVMPQADARLAWRLKRISPERWTDLALAIRAVREPRRAPALLRRAMARR